MDALSLLVALDVDVDLDLDLDLPRTETDVTDALEYAPPILFSPTLLHGTEILTANITLSVCYELLLYFS